MKPWEKSWDSQQQGDQKPWEKSWGQTTQLLEDAFGFGEEPPEYNAFRSGAVDLLESAVGGLNEVSFFISCARSNGAIVLKT